ncbi:hypothetical protein OIU34_20850 [Pararhizobium sp. BT-229]|uniref:hypothetical protein n=1 Tax=Pararhizobium sp. BT-229 TaxID=2986923 RepID=UPI0021F7D48D|nr:hypothetical protein [Pararhizobium sp. BT-229]MCV9964340.1 hypothetical protein [Pararhizobium sp. BT-229]
MIRASDCIVPADFPELRNLCWNRNPNRSITREEAFLLYDRNWRFVDEDSLTDNERSLIDALEGEFGAGLKIGSWRPVGT